MMNDPSKGSYFRGQILLSAKMLTQKETASMNLPDHVQTKRAKHLQESRHESKIVPYVFRAFMCSGTFDVLVDALVFYSLTHKNRYGDSKDSTHHGSCQSCTENLGRCLLDHVRVQTVKERIRAVDGDQGVET